MIAGLALGLLMALAQQTGSMAAPAAMLGAATASADVTAFEDGSAILDYGTIRIIVPAFDSSGDAITVERIER